MESGVVWCGVAARLSDLWLKLILGYQVYFFLRTTQHNLFVKLFENSERVYLGAFMHLFLATDLDQLDIEVVPDFVKIPWTIWIGSSPPK